MKDKKVRAWDKVTETYLYSDEFPSMWQFYKELESRGIRHFETEDYIGLKDKKRTEEYPEGQEIYEGDIVKGFCALQQKFPAVVEWFEYSWRVNKHTNISIIHGIEVIGNIHNNVDLLERSK